MPAGANSPKHCTLLSWMELKHTEEDGYDVQTLNYDQTLIIHSSCNKSITARRPRGEKRNQYRTGDEALKTGVVESMN